VNKFCQNEFELVFLIGQGERMLQVHSYCYESCRSVNADISTSSYLDRRTLNSYAHTYSYSTIFGGAHALIVLSVYLDIPPPPPNDVSEVQFGALHNFQSSVHLPASRNLYHTGLRTEA
jgi:hypothetical protein